MPSLFLYFYNLIVKRKALLVGLFVLVIGSVLYTATHIRFEEDITKIIPQDEKTSDFNMLFKHSKLTDRLVLHLTQTDTTQTDTLRAFADDLTQLLEEEVDSGLIKEVIAKIDEEQFLDVYDDIYEKLPILLEEKDYARLDELTDTTTIDERIEGAYKALLSPISFALKKSLLRDPLNVTSIALEKLKSFQVDDNFAIEDGYIISKDKKNLLLFITPAMPAQESFKNQQLLTLLEKHIKDLEQQYANKVDGRYFGAMAVAVSNANRIKKDVTITVTIALITLFLFISTFFKRVSVFFYILLPALLGACISLFLLSLLKPSLSLISIGVGSVLLGITIDYSLHVFTHYKHTGNAPQLFKDITIPILMSSLTTASAFLCLLFMRSEALRDLGLFAAFSMIASAVFALLVLPHFVKKREVKEGTKEKEFVTSRAIKKIAAYPFEKKRPLIIAIALVSLLCLFTVRGIQFETDLGVINYMPPHLEEAEKELNAVSSATLRGVYLMTTGATLEEALQKNEQLIPQLEELKQAETIRDYTNVSSLMLSEEEQQKRIDRWNNYWSNNKKQLLKDKILTSTQKLSFKPDAFDPFFNWLNKPLEIFEPAAFKELRSLFLNDYINEKEELTTVISLVRLEQAAKEMVYNKFQNNEEVRILDRAYLVNKFVEVLRDDFDLLVKISLLLVFIILHINYGRAELAIVSFIPIVLSWLWTVGLMNFLGLKFNIINIIITTFIFGLGIDYSIFIMQGLLQEYKYGEKKLASYKTSILLSLITTLAGIGVLIFAQHPALKSIAALAIIGIVSVIIICFTIEPLLFKWLVYKKGGEKREYPITAYNFFATIFTYSLLVIGCIILMIISVILIPLVFIPKDTRKKWLHYCIWGASRFYINVLFPRRKIINEHQEDFSKSGIIISNHQSLIDTPLMFQWHPKIIILTNDWVRRSPIFGIVARQADCYSVSSGIDALLPEFKKKLEEGYSIVIFPESTRSLNDKLKRFHKGAFYIADKLDADIIPLFMHGSGRFLRKKSFWGKFSPLTIEIGKRITANDPRFQGDYKQKAKQITSFYKQEYQVFKEKYDTADYFKNRVIENYIYKGAVLEWYLRVKIQLEDNYKVFDRLIPKNAKITDLGCGYGFMSHMLAYLSPKREVLGVDYDEEKVKVATHCKTNVDGELQFVQADLATYKPPQSDVFIIADVLHYLTPSKQFDLLNRCLSSLNEQGMIIIRDGDADLQERHTGTKLTEIFSIGTGFNKAAQEPSYISGKEIEKWAFKNSLNLQKIDHTKHTSNIIFVLQGKLK